MTEPVFPEDHDSGPQGKKWGGLGKRELLAVMAMQGMLAADVNGKWLGAPEKLAEYSVTCAEALLKRLKS